MSQVCDLSELTDKVHESSKKCGQTKIVVIDGPAGSGKTTLARQFILVETIKCFTKV